MFFFVQDKSQITITSTSLGELKDGGEDKKDHFERVQDDLRKLLATSKVKVMIVRICNLHSSSQSM